MTSTPTDGRMNFSDIFSTIMSRACSCCETIEAERYWTFQGHDPFGNRWKIIMKTWDAVGLVLAVLMLLLTILLIGFEWLCTPSPAPGPLSPAVLVDTIATAQALSSCKGVQRSPLPERRARDSRAALAAKARQKNNF